MSHGWGDFLREWKWPLIALLVVLAGYMIGKDHALRDNDREAAARQGTR